MAFTKFDLERTKRYAGEVCNLIKEVEKDISETDRHNGFGEYPYRSYNGILRAELRRRSMDLTRALADLRKS